MKKSFQWTEDGREQLEITLEIEDSAITHVDMKCVGCLPFLEMSQSMKTKLNGSIADLTAPTGTDHASMIWRQIISEIQEEWQLPVPQEELCHCRKVSTQRVDRAVVFGAHTIDEVRKRTSANTGCGTCKDDLMQIINHRLKVG